MRVLKNFVRVQNPTLRLFGASSVAAIWALACSAPGGDGSVDSSGIAGPSKSEKALSECVGEACPGGSREGIRETCSESKTGPRLLRRLTRIELRNTFKDVFPEVADQWNETKLSQDPVSGIGFNTDAKVLVVNGPTFKDMLNTAEDLADLVTAPDTLSALLPCSTDAADAGCATEMVNRYGYRLFRRPLSEDEVTRYVSYQQSVAERSDFATGAKWALSVMMQSPHAFYRSELGEASDVGFQLTPHELATNLAYTFTASTPSEQLLKKAENGELQGKDALRAIASEMLSDPENFEVAREFFRQWLGYTRVGNQSRDDEATFADNISHKLITETRIYLDTVLHNGGDVTELMTANFTAMDGDVSSFYGFGDVSGAEWVEVERPADRGIGILAQGSLLASTSHQNETSPTLRGLLFQKNFQCVTPPKPPDIVPPLSEAEGVADAKTTREKYELHHGVGGCASCHKHFDPYGFTFEQFDETGRYRADEEGETIDTLASVILPGGETTDVANIEELAHLVDQDDLIENCISGLMASYFLSGGGGANCLAEDTRAALASGEMSMRDFLVSLAASDHFSRRGL